jgi:hypothetical protein
MFPCGRTKASVATLKLNREVYYVVPKASLFTT